MCVFAFAHHNLNAQCGTTVNTGVCYTSGSLQTIAVDICPDNPADVAEITFTAGTKEGCCDEVIVYSGAAGSGQTGTQIYNSSAGGTSFSGIPTITGTTAGECLHVYIDADGSVDCASGAGVPASFDITCAAPPPPAGCLNSDNVTPICTDVPVSFAAGTDQTAASVDNPAVNYDCLSQTPNPAWYYLEIDATGTLSFDISNSNSLDVDWAAWGPFTDVADINTSCGSGAAPFDAPLDCDYTTAASGTIDLGSVTAGNIYVVLVTNFSNNPTDVTMVTSAGSTATTDCSIVNDCEADQDFTAPAGACSGAAIPFTAGAGCSGVDGPAGADQVVDLFVYAPGGVPMEAPAGYTIDRQAPTHTVGAGAAAGTHIDDRNPDLIALAYDATCAAPPSVAAGALVNNTCDPITVSLFTLVFDYTLDSDSDTNAEYGPLCQPIRYDIVIDPAPMTVVVTDDGSTCGTPTVELRNAAGGVCSTMTGPACSADGDTYNYDFSADPIITALDDASCANAPATLTGTVTCGGCTTPCDAVTPVWD